ncbi:MAG: glycosyltransferase family 4 protein [Rhodothermales bacterium]
MNIPFHIKRIAVLYSELSGYMAACLRALKENYQVELLVMKWPVVNDAPFDEEEMLGWIDRLYEKQDLKAEEILDILNDFEPQGIFMPGWIDLDYLKVARVMKRRNIPVVAGSDTQWMGTMRQRASKYLAPWYLHPAIDVLWVAGEKQRTFAQYLGYTSDKCWSGLYACDWAKFAKEGGASRASNTSFLYVGRYSEEKGIDLLVKAYEQYRSMVSNPWSLVCAGTGKMSSLLENIEGLENKGFLQPDDLPALMAEAGAFILPSRREPWGVVIQEAAASGLPLICSSVCGGAVHLLQDGYNGFLFEDNDVGHLVQRMVQLSEMQPHKRERMGQRSYALSQQFTPERWAETLMNGFATLTKKPKDLVPA